VTSLAWAEVHAVARRLVRDRFVTEDGANLACRTLSEGPWRRVDTAPRWDEMEGLAARWPLRGADLWHLSAAKQICATLPELVVLTFDRRLLEAAVGERMGPAGLTL
jgi:hypothetical protein